MPCSTRFGSEASDAAEFVEPAMGKRPFRPGRPRRACESHRRNYGPVTVPETPGGVNVPIGPENRGLREIFGRDLVEELTELLDLLLVLLGLEEHPGLVE